MSVKLTRNDEVIDMSRLASLVKVYEGKPEFEFEFMGWKQFMHNVQATTAVIENLGLNEAIRVDHAPDGASWYVESVAE